MDDLTSDSAQVQDQDQITKIRSASGWKQTSVGISPPVADMYTFKQQVCLKTGESLPVESDICAFQVKWTQY